MSWNGNEHNNLFRNEGTTADGLPQFADVAMALGADDVKDARGLAVADFDNDGDLDIVIATNPGDHGAQSVPPALLRNDIGHQRNYLAVELKGTTSNRDAVGAVVRIEAAGSNRSQPLQLTRHVQCGSGYASQNDLRLFFGLGDCQSISKVVVSWPSGVGQTLTTGVKINGLIRIVEGQESVEQLPFDVAHVAIKATRSPATTDAP